MKINLKFFQILLIVILFFCSSTIAQINSNEIIGVPIKIGNLEVAQHDFPERMEWKDAKIACTKLGKSWRLPTIGELNLLYKNKEEIGDFWISGIPNYWSSTVYSSGNAKIQVFDDGRQTYTIGWNKCYVRAVRSSGIATSSTTTTRNQKLNAATLYGTEGNNTKGAGGLSQQELLNLIIKSQLSDDASGLDPSSQFYSKPSNSNSRNSSSSSSSKTSNSNSGKKSHEFNVIVQWQKTCGNCPFPSPSIQNGVLLSQPSTRSGYYNLQPICPTCGKKPYGELSGNTNNMVGGSKTFRVVCKGN